MDRTTASGVDSQLAEKLIVPSRTPTVSEPRAVEKSPSPSGRATTSLGRSPGGRAEPIQLLEVRGVAQSVHPLMRPRYITPGSLQELYAQDVPIRNPLLSHSDLVIDMPGRCILAPPGEMKVVGKDLPICKDDSDEEQLSVVQPKRSHFSASPGSSSPASPNGGATRLSPLQKQRLQAKKRKAREAILAAINSEDDDKVGLLDTSSSDTDADDDSTDHNTRSCSSRAASSSSSTDSLMTEGSPLALSSGKNEGTAGHRARLERFYRHHQVVKTPEQIDTILHGYKGEEEELFRLLKRKYGSEPPAATGIVAAAAELDQTSPILPIGKRPLATERRHGGSGGTHARSMNSFAHHSAPHSSPPASFSSSASSNLTADNTSSFEGGAEMSPPKITSVMRVDPGMLEGFSTGPSSGTHTGQTSGVGSRRSSPTRRSNAMASASSSSEMDSSSSSERSKSDDETGQSSGGGYRKAFQQFASQPMF